MRQTLPAHLHVPPVATPVFSPFLAPESMLKRLSAVIIQRDCISYYYSILSPMIIFPQLPITQQFPHRALFQVHRHINPFIILTLLLHLWSFINRPPTQWICPHQLHQPATINHQPATINHQPATINHQPATINHQPATINHQPFDIPQSRPYSTPYEVQFIHPKVNPAVTRTSLLPRNVLTPASVPRGRRRPSVEHLSGAEGLPSSEYGPRLEGLGPIPRWLVERK
jgi:hypothetical protein